MAVWIGASALGVTLGSILAVETFPSAGFGRNPTGVYGPDVFGFVFFISAPLAITQWLALRWILPALGVALRRLWAWVPVTLVGWMATALPLWSVSAEIFVFVPMFWVVPLIPGALVLGLMQWGYWARYYSMSPAWVVLTVAGVVVGSVLVAAVVVLALSLKLLGSAWFPDFEMLCALTIVLGVSALQAKAIIDIRPRSGTLCPW